MGYVAMAVDVYGKGVKGENREGCFALMRPLVDDRPGKLRERLLAAYEQVKALEYVDSNKVGMNCSPSLN
jgi:dienelactone hydrolase